MQAEPVPASRVTDIQWWLSDALPTGAWGRVGFSVTVAAPFLAPTPLIRNEAGLQFGGAAPFLTDDALTTLSGSNTLGDLVFVDNGNGGGVLGNAIQDGGEPGLSNVVVRLYYDANSNGAVDAADVWLADTSSGATGAYGFSNLPDGRFVVAVDPDQAGIPFGYTATTPILYAIALDPAHAVSGGVTNLTADFGFTPVLSVNKQRLGSGTIREGGLVTNRLDVMNNLPGNGTGTGDPCTYDTWAATVDARYSGSGNGAWLNPANAAGAAGPDGAYANPTFGDTTEDLAVSGHDVGMPGGNITNVLLLIDFDKLGSFRAGDNVDVELLNNSATPFFSTNILANAFPNGLWTLNVTGLRAWSWADFSGSNITVKMNADKGIGSNPGGTLGVDAIGFRLTSDQQCGGAASEANTLWPVPLRDTYDADALEFVRATPLPGSTTVTGTAPDRVGTLSWADVGPIFPGGTGSVTVVFRVLEPPSNTTAVTTNVADSTGARFLTGWEANSATSSLPLTVEPAGWIGDFVWRDLNGNGTNDGVNETGIAGVTVRLQPPPGQDIGAGSNVALSTTTDADGFYAFAGLPVSGIYTVSVVTATLPGGTGTPTYDEDGGLDNRAAVDLVHNATDGSDTHTTADFGYQVDTTIEGVIWNDLDRNGAVQPDTGEPWLTNVTVYLCPGSSPCGAGEALATNTTAADGSFRFSGPYDGTYTVSVATNTGMMAGGTWLASYDSDTLVSGTNFVIVSVVSGSSDRADFSYFEVGARAIGDTVYVDWDGDGTQDPGEEGLPGVTVRLYLDRNTNGVIDLDTDARVATGVTGTNGVYGFSLLPAGTYLVSVDESGLGALSQTQDPDQPGTCTTCDALGHVTLTTTDRLDVDFGYQPSGTGLIGDTVWFDADGNGVQTAGEPGLAGVTVTLLADLNGDGLYGAVATAQTDAQGRYLFTELPDGPYRVQVDAADPALPADAFNNPPLSSTGTTLSVTVSGGGTYLDLDFGFMPLGAIGDTVFWDANRNGTQDWNEPAVSNALVVLWEDVNRDGLLQEGADAARTNAWTDGDGFYVFDGLTSGWYVVQVVSTGVLETAALSADPSADGLPCDDPAVTNCCDGAYGVRVVPGTVFLGADFGYVPPGVIGDTVWIDLDRDGIRDATEEGIPYIDVQLWSNGTLVATVETDTDGLYVFDRVEDGEYTVRVLTSDSDFPPDLAPVFDADGVPDAETGGTIVLGGEVIQVGGIPCSDCSLDVDFGFAYAGSNVLSGTVGLDGSSQDGVLGSGPSGVASDEAPFAGVTVYAYLWDDTGDGVLQAAETTLVGVERTDAQGDYVFAGLPAGDGNDRYVIVLAPPTDGLALTTETGDTPALSVTTFTDAGGALLSVRQVLNVEALIQNVDFAFVLSDPRDYGDLPVSYSTQIQDLPEGPAHVLSASPALYLGAGVDAEPNGQPTSDASGDGSDEDGVVPVGIWRDGVSGGQVQVTLGAGTGWLVGWIDFDRDGSFSGAGEWIVSQAVSATTGVYSLSFDVPSNSIPSTASILNARFRLYADRPVFPQFAYSGTVTDGEVEDYAWEFASIGDRVWSDSDADGLQGAGETGLVGVTLWLDLNTNGTADAGEPQATTDTNGTYRFGGLPAGTYQVQVDTNSLSAGLVPTFDADGLGTLHVSGATVSTGAVLETVDFGYFEPLATAAIRLSKTVSLSGACPGSELVLGTNAMPVTYCMRVFNPGSEALTNVSLSDPSLGLAGVWLTNSLAPGGSLSVSFPAFIAGNLTNVATVTGYDLLANTVSDNDTAEVREVRPDLLVIKTAEDTPDGDVRYMLSGSNVVYRYEVVNTGDTYLTGLVVTDNVLGVVGTLPGPVAPGTTNVFLATNLTLTADVTNVVVVTANPSDPDGDDLPFLADVTATDDAVVDVIAPGISVSKLVNGADLVLGTNGMPVTYAFAVVNTGDVALDDVTLDDTDLGFTTNIGTLAAGVSTTVTVATVISGDLTNTVTVTGDDPNDDPWTDSDTAEVDEVAPAIRVVKTAGSAADGAVERVGPGANVVYTYEVVNTGDTYLGTLSVTDDILGSVGSLAGPVAPGQTNVFLATNLLIQASVTNVATVTANPTDGTGADLPGLPDVSDTDDAVVDVLRAGYALTKTLVSPTNTPFYVGQTVVFQLDVVNTGEVDLVTVALVDVPAPGGLSFVEADPPPSTNFQAGVAWTNVGPLLPGSNVTVTVTYTAAVVVADATNTVVAGPTTSWMPLPAQTSAVPFSVAAGGVLGDRVWEDVNGNGVQDPSEPGISNVVVVLYDAATNAVATNVTDAAGVYRFDDLVPGVYGVGVAPPAGYAATAPDQGSDDLVDSDLDPLTGRTPLTVVTAGVTNDTTDAGFYRPGMLGDFIWTDTNLNGIQDTNELGLAGVAVELLQDGTNVVDATTSGSDGAYVFTNLPPGAYTIRITPPSGAIFTPANQGTNDTLDSDAAVDTGLTGGISVESGSSNSTWDAGLFNALPGIEVVKMAGDAADGAVEYILGGESVLYTYRVRNTGNTWLTDVALDDDRLGSITNVAGPLAPSGSFTVTTLVQNVRADVTNTATVTGTPAGSTGVALTGLTDPEDTDDAVVDVVQPAFGLAKQLVSFTNRAAIVGETFEFVLTVTNAGDVVLATVPLEDRYETNKLAFVSALPAADDTDNDGVLNWADVGPLAPGAVTNVSVRFLALAPTAAGTNVVTAAPQPPPGVPVPPAQTNGAPYAIQYAQLGNTVWVDLDGDGVPNENLGVYGLNGVRVDLYQWIGNAWVFVVSQTTATSGGARGVYLFDGLGAGLYRVDVHLQDVPTAYPQATTLTSIQVAIGPGGANYDADFGFRSGSPTAVDVVQFTAAWDGADVRVLWTTVNEIDHRGFNLYRAPAAGSWETARALAVRLNADLIGAARTGGGSYAWRDTNPGGVRWSYWLESVAESGEHRVHGPAVAERGDGEEARGGSWRIPAGGPAAEWVVRVDYADLAAAGVPVETVQAGELQVRLNGEQTALYVSRGRGTMREGDFLLFFCRRAAGEELRIALDWGPDARRMQPVYAEPLEGAGTVLTEEAVDGQWLRFVNSGGYARVLLTGFESADGWILDVTDPWAPRYLFGFDTVVTPDGVGYYFSYNPGEPADCLAAVPVRFVALKDVAQRE